MTLADEIPVLRSERLLLTIPGARAAEAYARFNRENERHLAPWTPEIQAHHRDPEWLAASLDGHVAQFREGRAYKFCVFAADEGADGTLLGLVNFSEVVRGVFLACYLGYALAERAQGAGLMTEACRTGIAYMFEQVGLHRIMAAYMPHNARSAAVLRRLGFAEEGRAASYLYLAGAWRDHVLTALVNPSPIEPA